MAVHIRLRRTGTTRKPAYRVVVADSRAARDGKFIEVLGHYNPLTEPPTIKIEAGQGAGVDQQGRPALEHRQESHWRASRKAAGAVKA